ncbi:MAG: DUF4377 domain-containing protein [Caldilineaceae bacterium]
MRREQTNLFFMTFFLLIAMACTPIMPPADEGGTTPAGTVPATATTPAVDAGDDTMTELTMYIAPERVACTGVAPMQCLQVKFDAGDSYELFYDGIDGFVYVPGYNYELRVQRLEREKPPADASKYLYSLIEIVAQTPAYTGETLTLEGKEWQLIAFGDEEMVMYQPEVAVITATFVDGRLSGSAGCNSYGGEYTVAGNTLTLSPVASTLMACADETVMAAESAYLTALASAGDYAIAENLLTITYAAGQLTFMAAETETAVGSQALAAETECLFAGTGATIAIDDKRASFTCGTPDVVLLGDVETGAEGWLIEKATLTRQNGTFTIAESTQATIRFIELSDGRRCAWAGSGATLAVEGKRANFTCDSEEDVLIGISSRAQKAGGSRAPRLRMMRVALRSNQLLWC